ncbi:endonuclease-reverse transcriptase HmRTE-e01 [Danaus plexippus plexippus]|uniref:Endonuclease-reverse transcriptase HmRTE-e01 n=1 Tax=Danaus plexippus plexippus TaxID=278856 RepID=A0A212EM56_DANPL|nr:endonuclease-reverse transcriptase HmRTE-e01 [Danaus plexippus plexippus]
MHTTEMRMLRWAGEVTLADKVKNKYISGSFKMSPIEEKLSEACLRRYGRVKRRPENNMTRQVLSLDTGTKKRGSSFLTWMSVINKDLKEAQLDALTI